GRAVQEAFGRRWLIRSCVNVFGVRLEHVLRAIMDISAHAILLADRSRRTFRVTRVRTRREDRSSIVVSSSRKTRRVMGLRHRSAPGCSFVRAWRPFLRPDLRMPKLRRAQGPSGLAVARALPLAPA